MNAKPRSLTLQRLILLACLLTVTEIPKAAAWQSEGLRLRGRLMTRYEVRDEERKVGRWTDTLWLEMARLDARFDIVDDLRLAIELELAGGFEIKDVFVRYAFHPAAQLTVGHFKKPFSRLQMTPRWYLVIPRRGILDQQVISDSLFGGFGGRDIGLMLSGRVGQKMKLRYFAGVFDGSAVQNAFFKDPDDPDQPNTSHRDYLARVQLRVVKGLVLAVGYCHKRSSVITSPGTEDLHSYNLFGGDIRWTLGKFRLQLEGAYGDNPNASAGHKLIGGHAIASRKITLSDSLALTPAILAEILDPDDQVAKGWAVRLAGALNLDVGTHTRIILSAEGGIKNYTWEVPEYVTPDQLEPVIRPPREVPTRIFLQLNVSL